MRDLSCLCDRARLRARVNATFSDQVAPAVSWTTHCRFFGYTWDIATVARLFVFEALVAMRRSPGILYTAAR